VLAGLLVKGVKSDGTVPPGFTIAEWMAIVAAAAQILDRGTWVLRHEGSDRLALEGVLWLARAGAAVTWVQLRGSTSRAFHERRHLAQ
jgi:hypothetical protein